MIGKVIALVAIMASVVSADCGCLTGCNRVVGATAVTVGPTYRVASAVPACGPIANPSCVIDPIRPISGTGCNGLGYGYGYGFGNGFGYGCGLYGVRAIGGIC